MKVMIQVLLNQAEQMVMKINTIVFIGYSYEVEQMVIKDTYEHVLIKVKLSKW